MESNKEEAVKAKGIAEKKMEAKDFVGARKIALKAQRLDPDLENITQIIIVCDVHCSAEEKVYGNEKDWYGILQVAPTADEASIKKQFRKFALLLHPDKNKFYGAADAFKLIGEAQRVLLDREKRMLHDIKRKSAAPSVAPQQASRRSNVGKPPGASKTYTNNVTSQVQGKQFQQTAQTGFHPTFWTVCPFCSVRYQYYRTVLNKLLSCQSCGKSFTGYEVNAQGSQGTNWRQPEFPQQKEVHNHGPSKVGPQNSFMNTTKVESGRNFGSGNAGDFHSKAGVTSEVKQGNQPSDKGGEVKTSYYKQWKPGKSQTHGNSNGIKKKHTSESSESFESESSTGSEEDIIVEDGGYYNEQFPRRSSRSKRNVSYTENLNDDDEVIQPSKRAKGTVSPLRTEEEVQDTSFEQEIPSKDSQTGLDTDVEVDEKAAKAKEQSSYDGGLQNDGSRAAKASEKENSTEDAAAEPEVYEYPDPDFSDFEKGKKENCFAVGQTWAIYDTQGCMPRFYARIRKVVLRPKFKVRITWLEPDPDDEDEIRWAEEDLPISCGKYRHGSSENSEDLPMFSHLISWEKGIEKDTYKIYPRKGEIWALFKNWDIHWSLDPDNHKEFEYEFVEILSDFTDGLAVSVAYLAKVKGFSCLFRRRTPEGLDSFKIAPKELFRFSHRVPSFRMTGEERNDVPKGSFELDPACLPTNLEEVDAPTSEDKDAENMHPGDSWPRFPSDSGEPIPESHADVSLKQGENQSNSNSRFGVSIDKDVQNLGSDTKCNSPDNIPEGSSTILSSPEEAFEIPDSEFYKFDTDKSQEKFEIGQIWALYSDEDGLPKYYVKVKKVDHLPDFKVTVALLSVCSTLKDMIQWMDQKMPIPCGRFRIKKVKKMEHTSTVSFSHQVKAEISNKKEEFDIFPRKGDVWALYKNWSSEMTCSDLDTCDYEMVEVLEENASGIDVLVLEQVNGFKSVFRAQMKGLSAATTTIPRTELLRFSHQIPAFRLTEEKGGSLKGCLELDPAALPIRFFSS